jgi:hypothetical protein
MRTYLSKNQLLWVDLDLESAESVEQIASCFPLEEQSLQRTSSSLFEPSSG